jgi:hypothetical protein
LVKERNTMARISEENKYRHDAIKAAKELQYGKAVITQIKNAQSDSEITRIMKTARNKKFKMDEVF